MSISVVICRLSISVYLLAGILLLQGHQPGVMVCVVGTVSLDQTGLQAT